MPIRHAIWKVGENPTPLAESRLASEQQLEDMIVRDPSILSSEWMLIVDLAAQLLPGTFGHAVHHLVTHELDLSRFDARFRNDVTGGCPFSTGSDHVSHVR